MKTFDDRAMRSEAREALATYAAQMEKVADAARNVAAATRAYIDNNSPENDDRCISAEESYTYATGAAGAAYAAFVDAC